MASLAGNGLRGLIGSCLAILSLTAGCHSRVDNASPADVAEQTRDSVESVRELLRRGHADRAAERVYSLLIQRPDDPALSLLAAEIEASRDNSAVAVELIKSIDLKGDVGKEAAELLYRQSVLISDGQSAERALDHLEAIDSANVAWKHERWSLLNRQGRRQEASQVADQLCRDGLASDQELLSLIRRNESFPRELPTGAKPEEYFFRGEGVARWYFTQKDHQAAIAELESQRGESRPTTPSADALYGRLLAETQSVEKLAQWYATSREHAKPFSDYWAALGRIFIDGGEHALATRALMQAVYLNPTDRICFQRLGLAFAAVGKTEDAAQFRYRGIDIAATETAADDLLRNPNNLTLRKSMSRKLMELGRPFETLQWTQSFIPASARRELTAVKQHRTQLSKNPVALTMASEAAMLGLAREPLPDDGEIRRLLGDRESIAPLISPTDDFEPLAVPRLTNVASAVGLDLQWYHDDVIDLSSIPIYQSVGGGIGVIDYDLDGWPDVYFAQGSAKPLERGAKSNQLMRNVEGHFRDVTQQTATEDYYYSSGQAVGDVNQDGFPDIYVGNLGDNRLLVNNGDGTFTDRSGDFAPHDGMFTTSVAIADIDGDALPDLFEGNYVEMERAFELPKVGPDGREVQPSPLEHFAQADRWFRNRGDGRFDVALIDNTIASPGTSLGIVITDFNHDGLNEIFVGNDERPNHYLLQDEVNQFRNAADALGCANGFNGAATGCMGIATGDFNRDGWMDMQIANFKEESASLYLQNKSGSFVDAAVRYGLDKLTIPYVGFGTKAVDIDRNGWLDFLVTNGHIFDMRDAGKPFQMPPQLLMARGDHYEQVEVEDPSGYWRGEYVGRAMAMIDFNRDYQIDLLIGHLDAKTALLRNETDAPGHFIQLELMGTASERDAIGARVVVEAGGRTFTQWVTAGDGYFSSDEAVLEIAVGTVNAIQSIRVHWPAGSVQTYRDIELDRRYLAIENEPRLIPR